MDRCEHNHSFGSASAEPVPYTEFDPGRTVRLNIRWRLSFSQCTTISARHGIVVLPPPNPAVAGPWSEGQGEGQRRPHRTRRIHLVRPPHRLGARGCLFVADDAVQGAVDGDRYRQPQREFDAVAAGLVAFQATEAFLAGQIYCPKAGEIQLRRQRVDQADDFAERTAYDHGQDHQGSGLLIPCFRILTPRNFDEPPLPGQGTRPTAIPAPVGPVPPPGGSCLFHGIRSPEPQDAPWRQQ